MNVKSKSKLDIGGHETCSSMCSSKKIWADKVHIPDSWACPCRIQVRFVIFSFKKNNIWKRTLCHNIKKNNSLPPYWIVMFLINISFKFFSDSDASAATRMDLPLLLKKFVKFISFGIVIFASCIHSSNSFDSS